MRIDIVADVVCPWCFIGKRRLERAMAMRPELRIHRVWRPFQLNPDIPLAGMPRELYLQMKFGPGRSATRIHANIAAVGKAEGIDFAFDRIERVPNTLLAHRLIRLAAEAGRADAVVEALFHGYFVEAADIGDIAVLAAIGARAGLDVRRRLAAIGGTDVRADDQRARRLGVNAVPCFIFDNGYAISGAQEPEMFLPLFDLAATAGRAAAD
ncbi:MAG TPA: DsbA family oxidoreductase [Stellaceae bacterium]|nr:DsbA family oxidoreductase [Stellaceae bacterium]